jgi:predicted transcriptional regulator
MESDMAEQTTVTFRTSTETKARLDKLATAMRRSKSFLTNAAVEQFLAEEEAFIADVEAGLRELNEGQGVNGEDLTASLLEHLDDVARTNKTG